MTNPARARRCRGDGGFTLQELLVTIVMLGIIAAPLAACFYVAIHDTVGVGDKVVRSHDAAMSTRLFTRDVQSADAVYGLGNTTLDGTTRILPPEAPRELNAVAFGSTAEGWAVGNGGLIMHSADGGVSWDEQSSGVSANLFAVDTVRKDNIVTTWVAGAGGLLLRSVDGSAWASVTTGTTADLYVVNFKDENKAVIAGAGGLLRFTKDKTATWVTQNVGTSVTLRSAAVGGGKSGMAVGDGGIARKCIDHCEEASAVWSSIATGTTTNLRSGSFTADAKNGIAVGDGGRIISFKNLAMVGSLTLPGGPNLNGAALISDTAAWVAGAGGAVFKCTTACYSAANAGNWNNDGSGITEDLRGISALDTKHVWAVGLKGVIGSATVVGWTAEDPALPGVADTVWNGSVEANENAMWTVGTGGRIAKHNGTQWSGQTSNTTNNLYGVDFQAANKGIAVGDGYARFSDGATWTAYTSASSSLLTGRNLRSVAFQGNDKVIVAGLAGAVLRCSHDCDKPATATWATVTLPVGFTTADFAAVSMQDGSKALLVGPNGTMLFTGNSGATWAVVDLTSLALPAGTAFTGVQYTAPDAAVVVGSGGTILRCTEDPCSASASWQVEISPTTSDLLSVTVGEGHRQWASGRGGTILVWDEVSWSVDGTGSDKDLFAVIEPKCPAGTPAGTMCAHAQGAANTAISKSAALPTWSSQQLEQPPQVKAPVCAGATGPTSDTFVLAFASSDDTGDRSVTYVVRQIPGGERRLVRQLCTRPTGAAETDLYGPAVEVVVAHYLASGDPVVAADCLAGKTCTLNIAGVVTPEDSLPFVLRATRRTA